MCGGYVEAFPWVNSKVKQKRFAMNDARLRLLLTPDPGEGLVATLRARPVASGPSFAPGEGPERVSASTGGRRVSARRDLEEEAKRGRSAAETLGLGAFPEAPPWEWRIERDEDALDLVARLADACPPGLVVEWAEGRTFGVTREATPKDLRVAVREARDWFGIEGEVDVDGAKASLAALLDLAGKGRRYLPVSGGRWLRLSRVFQERLREMAALVVPAVAGVEVSSVAAPLVRGVVDEAGAIDAPPAWTLLGRRFEEAMRLSPTPRFALRPYQVEGYRWMRRLAAWGVGGVLADDMGLGKTVDRKSTRLNSSHRL